MEGSARSDRGGVEPHVCRGGEHANERQKLAAAKSIVEFSIQSVVEAGLMCLDLHPANMIFSGDEVYLIDFGFFLPASPTYVALLRDLVLCYLEPEEKIVEAQYRVMLASGLLTPHPDVREADMLAFVDLLGQQVNWEWIRNPALQARFNELFFSLGLNTAFGSQDSESFLGYLGQIQVFRTLSKLSIPQPFEWGIELAAGLRDRLQRAAKAG